MKNVHLIMPMGGRGSRFKNMGDCPKPLITLLEKPFFFWATQSIAKYIKVIDITFVVLKEHVEKFGIDRIIKDYYPDSKIVVIPDVLDGAVLTCAEGLREICDNEPILFNDCDHAFRSVAFEKFCEEATNEIDGALLTFNSNEPIYSFLEKDANGNVIRTVEKQAISNEAICGCYYFGNKDIFNNALKMYLEECSYNEYYVSGMYNTMANQGLKIRSFPVDYHIPFGIPEEYEEAKKDGRLKELI